MNDARLDCASSSSHSAGAVDCGRQSSQHHFASAPHHHEYGYQIYTAHPVSQNGFNGGLTEGQLYTHDYGHQTKSGVDTWKQEEQRQGPWYGYVQQREPQMSNATDESYLCLNCGQVVIAPHICR